jgi:hypothetical protein
MSTSEGLVKDVTLWCSYTMEYQVVPKKKEEISSVVIWTDPQDTLLNDKMQGQCIICYISCSESKKEE